MIDYRIYRIDKTDEVKSITNQIDITSAVVGDIVKSNSITTQAGTLSFSMKILPEHTDVVSGIAEFKPNYRLPIITDVSDILHLTLVDINSSGNMISEETVGLYIVSIVQTDDIDNDNQLVNEFSYDVQVAAVSLEPYLQGFAFPNKIFTNPEFINGYDEDLVHDEDKFNMENLLNKVFDIWAYTAPIEIPVGYLDVSPIEASIGKNMIDIIPTKTFVLENLNMWQVIVELFREIKVTPGLRYRVEGNGDLVLELYDKEETYKDVTSPFLDLDNLPGITTYEENIDASRFNTSIMMNFKSSPIGTDITHVEGYNEEWERDYYEYPARGFYSPMTTFNKQTFHTKEDRNSAIFKMPYPMNSYNSIRHVVTDDDANDLDIFVRDRIDTQWIKTVDIKGTNATKFTYDIGVDFITGIFAASGEGTGGDPETLADRRLGWGDGETSADIPKFQVDGVPILNTFSIVHHRNNTQGLYIPSYSSIAKSGTSLTKFCNITSKKDGNFGQGVNSVTQILRYNDYSSVSSLLSDLVEVGRRSVEDYVTVESTIAFSKGNNVVGGVITNKIDITKNYVQLNIDAEAISSFDPVSSSQGGISRHDVLENFLVLHNDNDVSEFGNARIHGNQSDLFIDDGKNSSSINPLIHHLYQVVGERSFEFINDNGTQKHAYPGEVFDHEGSNPTFYAQGTNSRDNTSNITSAGLQMLVRKQGSSDVAEGKPYYIAGKAFTTAYATGVILTTQDEVNITHPRFSARTKITSGENVTTMTQSRHGDTLQRYNKANILITRRIISPISDGATLSTSNVDHKDKGGFFSNYPSYESNELKVQHSAAQYWNGESTSRSVTDGSILNMDVQEEYHALINTTIESHKDTSEKIDYTFQFSVVNSPRMLAGTGMLSGNSAFSTLRDINRLTAPGCTVLYSEYKLPEAIDNIRYIYEDMGYDKSTKHAKRVGDKNVYVNVYTGAASSSETASSGSRYGNLKLVSFSESAFRRSSAYSLRISLNDAHLDKQSYGEDGRFKYYMVFDNIGTLLYRNVVSEDFSHVRVPFSPTNPFYVKL